MFKRIVAVLLVGVLAVSLAACSQTKDETSKSTEQDSVSDKLNSTDISDDVSDVTVVPDLVKFFQTHTYTNFEIQASNGRAYFHDGDAMLVTYPNNIYSLYQDGKHYVMDITKKEYSELDSSYGDMPYTISSIVLQPENIDAYAQKSDDWYYDTSLEDSEDEVGMFKYKIIDADTITVALINYYKDLGDITMVDPVMEVTYKVTVLDKGALPKFLFDDMKKIEVSKAQESEPIEDEHPKLNSDELGDLD